MIALVLAAAVMAGVSIPWAIRADRTEYHTLHTAGCTDCQEGEN